MASAPFRRNTQEFGVGFRGCHGTHQQSLRDYAIAQMTDWRFLRIFMSLTHCYISTNQRRKKAGRADKWAHLQCQVLRVISLDGHFLTSGLCLRRSRKPANGLTIRLADDDVGLVVSAELSSRESRDSPRHKQQHSHTPNSSVSPHMLARNSSSSVGMGVASGGDSDPGSRASGSVSTSVKEESNDSVDPYGCFTTSKLETEHSNVDPPKEDNVSEDSIGLVTTSPLVILGTLIFEAALFMAPIA